MTDFINPYALAPKMLPVARRKQQDMPSFGEASAMYRDAKQSGLTIPSEVMGIIALHAAEHDIEVTDVLHEIMSRDSGQEQLI